MGISDNKGEASGKRLISTVTILTPEARQKLIAEAAYKIAESRGFQGNCELHDWLEAEEKINRIYGRAE